MAKGRKSLKELLANYEIASDTLVAKRLEEVREASIVKECLEEDVADQRRKDAFLIASAAGESCEDASLSLLGDLRREVDWADDDLVKAMFNLADALIADDDLWARWRRPLEDDMSREGRMGQQALWLAFDCGVHDPLVMGRVRFALKHSVACQDA